MSDDFQLESPPADLPAATSDAEWVERLGRLTADPLYRKIGILDQDFLTDMHGKSFFSPAQRRELQRIWHQWRHLA